MPLPNTIFPAALSLGAVCAWGTSDFFGGYAARRANALILTTIAHAAGAAFMILLAVVTGAEFPSHSSIVWACASGLSGGGALALFYRALASGNMGLTAPVAAVVSASIPVIFSMAHDGFPGAAPISGFVLAGVGIWLVSRSEGNDRPEGIGMAMLAGAGFAGYYLFIRQAGAGSPFWLSGLARIASLVLTAIIVLCTRSFRPMDRRGVNFGIFIGCIDVIGSALFVRANQVGRLDVAVVISSLYPVVTVLLARVVLKEHFTRWRVVGMIAAIVAVPLIAL